MVLIRATEGVADDAEYTIRFVLDTHVSWSRRAWRARYFHQYSHLGGIALGLYAPSVTRLFLYSSAGNVRHSASPHYIRR